MTLTGLAFVLVFFSGLALALFRSPVFGLYTYIGVFYVHPPSRWWGALLPDLRWSLLAAAVALVAAYRYRVPTDRAPWYANPAAKLLIAYTLWLWIQNLWALDKAENMSAAILFTKYVLLFFLFYRIVDTPAHLRGVLLVHVAGCLYLGWLAFIEPEGGRLEGVGGPGIDEANAFAMQLSTGLVAGAMILLTGNKYEKAFCFVAMPFILNGIVLAGSRGAFLAVLCAGFALAVLKPPQYRKTFYAYAALAVMLFAMVASNMFLERIGTLKAAVDDQAEMDTSAESRFVIAAAQWRMTLRYPFGTGHRGTAVLSSQYMDEKYLSSSADLTETRARSSHNTFMTALSEQGFIGALMFLWLWWWCAKTSRKLGATARAKWSPQACGDLAAVAAALVVIFVAGIFVDYLKAEVHVWMVALLASSSALVHGDRLRESQPVTPTRIAARDPPRNPRLTA